MNTLLRNADVVKIACLAQLVNTIAPIMTESNGKAWVQTIYYPFLYASRYGRGTSLRVSVESPTYACAVGDDIPNVDCAATLSNDENEVVLFLINRDLENQQDCQITLSSPNFFSVMECVSLCDFGIDSVNTATHAPVFPKQNSDYSCSEHMITVTLPKFSWNMVRIQILK
jgi:alpha-N-arabinofuranosidase